MASTASQVQRQGQEGGDRGDSVTMSIWCHVCNQQEVVSGSSSENERDQQTNIVCPSCGSDFIEIVGNTRRLGTVASGGVLRGNIHHEAAEARTRRVDFESLEGLLSSNNSNNNNNGNTNDINILRTATQSDAANTATGASGDSAVRASAAIRAGGEGGGGVGSRAGYHFLHGPISVRVETRGAPGVGVPQLLQSLFSAGGLSSLGVDLGHSGVQAGDFVFGGNDALERIIAQLAENHVAASVPASPQVISKLRRIRCKKELQGCSAEGCTAEECSICQEGYEGEFTAIQMPCSHVFHEECLLQWLKEQNTCPICRLKLPSAASEAEERERVETDRLARTSTPDMVQRARAASVGLTGDLSGNTSSSSDEEMLRRMNDIDEEPPTSMEGVFMGAGEAEAEAEAEQERSGSDLEHRSNKGFRGVGFHVGHLMKRLAPLGNVLKWASKPLGRVVKLGVCLTDKLLGK